MMIKLLEDLTQCFGVSGNEEDISKLITEQVKDYADEITTDAMGNLIVLKRGGSGENKKIMVAAHMDEIGVIVTHIDKNGFLRFSNLGGVQPFTSIGQRVVFRNKTVGTIAYEQKEDVKSLKLSSMYIDIGASDREEAEKSVNIGDGACFEGSFHVLGDRAISKAMDDRCGCWVAIMALKALKDCKTENDIYFVFTVQEELGLRGAKTAAYGIMPHMALALDVTMTGDTPESHLMDVKVGHGPAIKIKDSSVMCHPKVIGLLRETAERLDMPVQYEVLERGGTDIGTIHLTGTGVISGAVSIPTRYVHSPGEMISLKDLENAAKLVAEAVKTPL